MNRALFSAPAFLSFAFLSPLKMTQQPRFRRPDLLEQRLRVFQRQDAAGQWVQQTRLQSEVPVALQDRPHGKLLRGDVGQVQVGELGRQSADVARVDARLVGQTGHLDAAAFRQVVNQARRSSRCR